MQAKIKFSWTTEIVGGVAVFLAMSYVLLANPRILAEIPDRVINGVLYAGPDAGVVFVSTCLLAGLLSIAIGWRAWSPSAIACGMGLNSLMVTFCSEDLGFNWRWLLVLNLVVGGVVLAMSRSPGKGQRSLRDRLLRDPNFLPSSLTSIVEASVAGMLAGIAIDMLTRDERRILGVETIELPHLANDQILLPLGVAVISLVALLAASLIAGAIGDRLEAFAKREDAHPFLKGLARVTAWVVRLANSVKIILAAIAIAVVFDKLYGWSGLAAEQIEGLRFAPPVLEGPFNFKTPFKESLGLAVIYLGTVAFVLLFDVSGSPHQMLSETPPASVVNNKQAAEWPDNREERVRRGFAWEALGNVIAPFFSVSPVTCYGENNVVRDVGLEPNDGARTGIPSILAGVLFLGALGYAFWRPAEVQFWLSAIPGSAIAVMLAWISLIIGHALAQNLGSHHKPTPGADPEVERFELIIAGLASLIASIWQGLALGLCVGILGVFFVRLIASFVRPGVTVQGALYALALLALIAGIGQWMMI